MALMTLTTSNIMAQQKIVQTAGHDALGEFAPEFARLNDDMLFGEVWSRNDLLSLRDRSLITVISLVSQGITDSSLQHHMQNAKKNGITRTEIAEALTHNAFYAGWPKAWAAFRIAKEVWADDVNGDDAMAEFQRSMIFPIGQPNTAYENISRDAASSLAYRANRYPLPTSLLNPDAATTVIYITRRKAEARCSLASPAAAGIRKRENPRRRYFPALSYTSRPM